MVLLLNLSSKLPLVPSFVQTNVKESGRYAIYLAYSVIVFVLKRG